MRGQGVSRCRQRRASRAALGCCIGAWSVLLLGSIEIRRGVYMDHEIYVLLNVFGRKPEPDMEHQRVLSSRG